MGKQQILCSKLSTLYSQEHLSPIYLLDLANFPAFKKWTDHSARVPSATYIDRQWLQNAVDHSAPRGQLLSTFASNYVPSLVYSVHARIGPRCVHFRKTYIVIYLPYHTKFSTLSKFIIIVCCIISLTLQDWNFKLPSWWMLYWSYLFQLMPPLPSSYFGGERSDLSRGYCLSCNLLFSLLVQSMLRKAWENINPIVALKLILLSIFVLHSPCRPSRRTQGCWWYWLQ